MESIVPDESLLPQCTAEEIAQIKALCPQIKSNAHLKQIVRSAAPQAREQVHALLSRYITQFKPCEFSKLWAFD